ncbi:MAG: hypothetical protein AT712_02615 [Caldivirga sp. CIS_19]|nr:MAG: hypothetical protein AT712_02615 [Caldivirga sp. CIS_19]
MAFGTGFWGSLDEFIPCSDGVDGGIEWLFQLKENEEIETMFQWFKVQCKMKRMHETCKTMRN